MPLVTGVQTCALPIVLVDDPKAVVGLPEVNVGLLPLPAAVGLLQRRHEAVGHLVGIEDHAAVDVARGAPDGLDQRGGGAQEALQIGRAACRERVCKYVEITLVAAS